MGVAIGIVLVGATIASYVLINARARRMTQRYNDSAWFDPGDGERTQQHDPGRHGHHGHGPAGGHHGGGHHGGGHSGGGHSGGDSGGGGGHHG